MYVTHAHARLMKLWFARMNGASTQNPDMFSFGIRVSDSDSGGLGKLRKSVNDFGPEKKQLYIPNTLTQCVIEIFIIQLMRIPDFYTNIYSRSIFAKPLGLSKEFYSVFHHNEHERDMILSSIYKDIAEGIFKDYSANILEIPDMNRRRSLLLTTSHFTTLRTWLILVLNPYCGVVLLPTSENHSNMFGASFRYIVANDDKDVDLINAEALKHECSLRSNPKLVGLTPELEKMQQHIGKPRK